METTINRNIDRQQKLLAYFINSEYFANWDNDNRSPGSAGIILNDPDRFDRIMDAAESGCEGSTHYEVINDWRKALDDWRFARKNGCERILDAINAAIDAVETWHETSGTLHNAIG